VEFFMCFNFHPSSLPLFLIVDFFKRF
jgi:hypothetical protein